jgi:hypothetical protein
MKKEEELCEGGCAGWGLETEDRTDLWSEELLLYEIDLFYGSEVNWGSLDRIRSNT